MGRRGYVFVGLDSEVTPQKCLEIRRNLEAMQEVITVDEVGGFNSVDMLALVDAPIMLADVAHQIARIPGVTKAQSVPIISGPEF